MKLGIILSILILSILAINLVSAADIAYLVRNPGNENANIIGVFNEMNLSYKLVYDINVTKTNFSDYRMLLVADNQFSSYASIPVTTKKSLVMNTYYLSNWKIAKSSGQMASSQFIKGALIYNNSINANFSSPVQLYNKTGVSVNYLPKIPNRAYGLKSIVATNDFDRYPIISILMPGDSLYPSGNATQRTAFYGLNEINYWTNESRTLFKNTIKWILSGEDNDHDGFFSENDCNDNNSSVWRNLPGYLDSDKDGYGTGNLLQVCSGNNLPAGYSNVSGDCNDNNILVWRNVSGYIDVDRDGFGTGNLLQVCSGNNLLAGYSAINGDCNDNSAGVNPNGTELAYNHVDENCDGIDLGDVDNDGYCKAGYLINNKTLQCNLEKTTTGSDCNDNSAGVNPGIIEILNGGDKNCAAENPQFIGIIENQSWNEDGKLDNAINLSNYFKDFDNNVISYSIEQIYDDKNVSVKILGSLVSFNSTKDWNGQDWVIFRGTNIAGFNVSNKVYLNVIPVNDAPVLNPITNITIIEGEKAVVNPTGNDIDNSVLYYSFSPPLNSSGEWQTKIGDAGVYYPNVTVSDGILTDSKPVKISVLAKLYINEVLGNPAEGNDWVELYNPGNASVNLSGCKLQDLANNNLTLSGTIDKFEVFEWDSKLNNAGDDVKLICSNILIDNITYGDIGIGKSYGRKTDSSSEWIVFDGPTKEISNEEDVLAPIVILKSPADGQNLSVNSAYLNFTASDDKAISLNCSLYSDILGTFREISSKTVANNENASWFYSNLSDKEYAWKVICSDSKNLGESEIRKFNIDVPQPSVISDISPKFIHENSTLIVRIEATDPDMGTILTYWINSSRFVQNITDKASFSWKPDFGDAGTYMFRAYANDGTFEVFKDFNVTVFKTNRNPYLISEIPNQNWSEDTIGNLNLSQYFADPDSDILSYSVSGNSNIAITFANGIAFFNPKANWSGKEEVIFNARDSSLNVSSNKLNLSVNPVNDAPVLNSISDIIKNEGEIVTITASGSDIDGDSLVYSINDSRFNQTGNVFTWQTGYGDSGIYYALVSVSDGKASDSKQVKITINNINEPPILENQEINITEDSQSTSALNAIDHDGTITKYEVTQETSNVDCSVTNAGLLTMIPKPDFYGTSTCTIEVTDNQGSTDLGIITINVANVNDKPVIDSYLPLNNPSIPDNKIVNFSIAYHDIDSGSVIVSWYVDNIKLAEGNSFSHLFGSNKNYIIRAIANDSQESAEHSWNLTTSNVPIAATFDGHTTDFTGLTELQLQCVNLTLERSAFGEIVLEQCVDLRDIVDLDNYVNIQHGFIGVDSNQYPGFKNKLAKLSFYGLSYNKTPTVYYSTNYDGSGSVICPENICSNINYNSGVLSFYVSGFSSYMVGDTLTCSQKSGIVCQSYEACSGNLIEARDTNNCCDSSCVLSLKNLKTCNMTDENIEFEISKPDADKEYKVGDSIDGKIKITNNFDSNKNFKIQATLYDLSKDKKVDDTTESASISDRKSKDISFNMTIPDDLDESHSYALYVKAYVSSNTSDCNGQLINLDITRDENNVQITQLDFSADSALCGDLITADMTVKNFGSEDDTSYVKLINSDLGLDVQNPEFDINSGDEERESLSFRIPQVQPGNYDIKARVYFNDGDVNEITKTLTVRDCQKQETVVTETSPETISLNSKTARQKASGIGLSTLNWMFLVGIIILIILIILILVLRKKQSS